MTDNSADHQKLQRQSEPESDQGQGHPSEPATAEKKHYEIDIFRAWCKSCGICAAFCPRHCIELDEEGAPRVEDPDQCTGCGWCELHCPDFAISVHARKGASHPEEED